MDTVKDYYAILGVLPSVEQSVLKAAYLALQKIYHTDVYKGEKAEGERRVKEINEAYSALSSPVSRAKYDAEQKGQRNGSGSFAEQRDEPSEEQATRTELASAWSYVETYFPEVEAMRADLLKLSPALALQFQFIILENKTSRKGQEIAVKLRREFFSRYFGKSPDIHLFVDKAINDGRRDVAIEVNRVITNLGDMNSTEEAWNFLWKIRDTMKYDLPDVTKKYNNLDGNNTLTVIACLFAGFIILSVLIAVSIK